MQSLIFEKEHRGIARIKGNNIAHTSHKRAMIGMLGVHPSFKANSCYHLSSVCDFVYSPDDNCIAWRDIENYGLAPYFHIHCGVKEK